VTLELMLPDAAAWEHLYGFSDEEVLGEDDLGRDRVAGFCLDCYLVIRVDGVPISPLPFETSLVHLCFSLPELLWSLDEFGNGEWCWIQSVGPVLRFNRMNDRLEILLVDSHPPKPWGPPFVCSYADFKAEAAACVREGMRELRAGMERRWPGLLDRWLERSADGRTAES
jgi:hypothetical protein